MGKGKSMGQTFKEEFALGEEITNIKMIPHVYEEHVGIEDKELIERLLNNFSSEYDTNIQLGFASKFDSEEDALYYINELLYCKEKVIANWLKARDDKRIILTGNFLDRTGYGYAKNTSFKQQYVMTEVIIVLELGYNGDYFSIVSAYPAPNKAIKEAVKKDRAAFFASRK